MTIPSAGIGRRTISSKQKEYGAPEDDDEEATLLLKVDNEELENVLDPDDKQYFDPTNPKIYCQRWLQLSVLFLLSMLTDWTCFSLSAITPMVEARYPGFHISNLVALFLVANVFSSLLQPSIVQRIGLRWGVILGSLFMLTGSLLRSGLPSTSPITYACLTVGTMFVGFAQPFFQNTPAQLVSSWFPTQERTLALTIAFQAPVTGVAAAFLVGTNLVQNSHELEGYLLLLSLFSLLFSIIAVVVFQDTPPTPPSRSAHERLKMREAAGHGFIDLMKQVLEAFEVPGFFQALTSFVVTDCVLNCVVTFMASFLAPFGYGLILTGICGATYQTSIVIGSVIVGHWVDRTKDYQKATITCFILTVIWLTCLSIDDIALNTAVVMATFVLLGLSLGPIEPCLADLAVEITYPVDDNAVLSIMQILGNVFAAAAVPIFRLCRDRRADDYVPSLYFLVALALMGVIAMSTFSSPSLLRIETDLSWSSKGRRDGYEELSTSTEDEEEDDDDNMKGLGRGKKGRQLGGKREIIEEQVEEIMKRMAVEFEFGCESGITEVGGGSIGGQEEVGEVPGEEEGVDLMEETADGSSVDEINANICP